jgi:NADH:ubiquinone oxidoreductase subunit 6 (subunit J)
MVIISSVFILINQNPINVILLLILIFFFTSCILIILNFSFLAFFFLSIYIGAIAIFFLFILRLIQIPIYIKKEVKTDFYLYLLSFFFLISFFYNFTNSIFLQEITKNYDLSFKFFEYFDTVKYIGSVFYTEFAVIIFFLTYIFLIIMFGTTTMLQIYKK